MKRPEQCLPASLPCSLVRKDMSTWPTVLREAIERSKVLNDNKEVWKKCQDACVTWEVYETVESSNCSEEELKGDLGFLHEANDFAAKAFLFAGGYECAKAQGTLDEMEVELTDGVLRIEAQTQVSMEETWVLEVRPKHRHGGRPSKKLKIHHDKTDEKDPGKDGQDENPKVGQPYGNEMDVDGIMPVVS